MLPLHVTKSVEVVFHVIRTVLRYNNYGTEKRQQLPH